MCKTHNNLIFSIVFIVIFQFLSSSLYAQLTKQDQADLNKYQQLLKEYQGQNNKNQTITNLSKIAFIYWNAQMNNEAINYFKQALDLLKTTKNKNAIYEITNQLGRAFTDIQQYDVAVNYYNEGLQISRDLKDKKNITSDLINIANVRQNQKKYDEAIKNLDEALIMAQELNDLKLIRRVYSNLSECHEKLGNSDNQKKYFDLWSTFDQQIKKIEMRDIELKSQIAVATANAEKKAKQLELDLQVFKLKITSDSLSKQEKLTKEQLMKNELLSKENALKDLAAKQKDILVENQRIIIFSFLIIFIIIIIFTVLILKQYQEKKKAYQLLAEQNEELKIKNEQIAQQNYELRNKNEQIEAQRLLLERKNQQITDSINYASRIQRAILPSYRALKNNFPDSFIFYQPKDIVSGDFYWFSQHGPKTFIAAVDCTGHSVPGAFMSMIGNTLLNEIINEKRIFDPAQVLDKLHSGIIQNLKKNNDGPEAQDDGMDITLCCIDKDLKTIEIALANHIAYMYTEKKNVTIEGDIFSIGDQISSNLETSFTNHKYPIHGRTTLYFFSDGFHDQFGGSNETKSKFMEKQFKNLLTENQNLDMDQQYELISSSLEKWKGPVRQTDDILVIGIRINE